ncbi:MAG: type VII toxin-antitoxin system MntA family adenylyltransferase antitoxin [bacterium]
MIKYQPITHNIKKLFPGLTERLYKEDDTIFAYITGSYGRDEANPLSDIDIAIYLEDGIKEYFSRKIDLINIITELLKTDEVDLIILNEVDSELAFNVIKSGSLFFSKDENRRVKFETRVIREYQDFEYHRLWMIKNFFATLKEEFK